MPRGVAHEDRLRAAALADVVVGMSISAAAAKHGVSRTTLVRWRNETAAARARVGQEKQDELGELIAGYIRASIAALITHAEFVKDEEWLRKQNAADLAVFDGVLFDKLARLLSAVRGPGDTRPELPAGTAAVDLDPARPGRPPPGG